MKKEHLIAAADGIKLFVLELIPDGKITGPPFFCIHGLTRNHRDFTPIFDFLLSQGRKVYAMDVRGRGRSDYDIKPENYQPPVYVGDVMAIFAALQIEKAVFIGTSMGGIISMIIAAFAPQLVAGMVLNDVGPEVNEEGMARIRNYVGETTPMANLDEAIERVKKIALSAYPKSENDDEFWAAFTQRLLKQSDAGLVFDYDAAIRNNVQTPKLGEPAPNLWPQFENMPEFPLALIRGEISDIITLDIVEKMRALKPNMIYAEIKDIGHAPILDEEDSLITIGEIAKITALL